MKPVRVHPRNSRRLLLVGTLRAETFLRLLTKRENLLSPRVTFAGNLLSDQGNHASRLSAAHDPTSRFDAHEPSPVGPIIRSLHSCK